MRTVLLKNALSLTFSPATLARADLRVSGGTIVGRAASLAPDSDDDVVDLTGKVIFPGLVCAHTHLYSSLSRGMPGPASPPVDFPDMLRKVWWRLDRALDAESITCSALIGAMEAARCGVTTIVDHHASPNAIEGSLVLIARALAEVGLRGVLCYETSDRDGVERRDRGLAENASFLSHRDPLFRGLVGAHASFTLSDDSLRRLGDLVEQFDSGIHIHLAEDRADPAATLSEHGRTILNRLSAYGLLRPRSVFAHCIHLNGPELDTLRQSEAWLVHNPCSNMNNAVGRAPVHAFGPRGALGTDGFTADLFEEMRAGYFWSEGPGRSVGPALMLGFLQNGSRLVSDLFGLRVDTLEPGAGADLVVLDYLPPTPLTEGNLAAHAVFGMRSSHVHSVMVNGHWVVRDRRFPHLDEAEIHRRAAEAARRLWRTMHDLPV